MNNVVSLHQLSTYCYYRYEKTAEDLTRFKTALNEKEMEVEDLIRKLKEASDKVSSITFCYTL